MVDWLTFQGGMIPFQGIGPDGEWILVSGLVMVIGCLVMVAAPTRSTPMGSADIYTYIHTYIHTHLHTYIIIIIIKSPFNASPRAPYTPLCTSE